MLRECLLLQGHLQSKKGDYGSSKNSSKITLVLLVVAISVFSFFWFSGWIPGLFILTNYTYSGSFT